MLHDRQKGDSFAIRHAFKLSSFFCCCRLFFSLFRFVPSSAWKIERHSMRNWNEISAMNTLFYLKSQYDIVKMCFSQLRNGFRCHVAVYNALHSPDVHDIPVKAMIKSETMRNSLAPAHRFDFIVSTCTNIFVFFVLFFEIAMLSVGGVGGYRYFAVVVENQAKTNERTHFMGRETKKNIYVEVSDNDDTRIQYTFLFFSVDTIAKYRKRKLGENCSNKKEVKHTIEFCSPHTHTTVHKMKLQNIETVRQYQRGTNDERSMTDVRVDVSSFAINMWVVNAEEGKLREKKHK